MLHALARGHEHLQDRHGNPDPRGDEGPGEKPGLFPVETDPLLVVKGSQPVDVLVILDPLFKGEVLGVGGGVGDRRTEKGRHPPGKPHFGRELGEGGSRKDDDRPLHGLRDPSHRGQPVVDDRASIQHGTTRLPAFLDAPLGLLKFQVAGVGVRRGRQKVGASLVLKTPKEGDMIFDQRHSPPGLHEGSPFLLRLDDFPGVVSFDRQPAQVFGGFFQIDVPACRPEGKDFFPFGKKFIVRPALVIQFHSRPFTAENAEDAESNLSPAESAFPSGPLQSPHDLPLPPCFPACKLEMIHYLLRCSSFSASSVLSAVKN